MSLITKVTAVMTSKGYVVEVIGEEGELLSSRESVMSPSGGSARATKKGNVFKDIPDAPENLLEEIDSIMSSAFSVSAEICDQ